MFEAQLSNSNDEDLLRLQQQLNDVYDSFVNKYGPINSVANRRVIIEDPDSPLLFALEHYDSDTKTAQKADIFSKRIVQPYQTPTSASNAKEALLYSLNERGWVDLDYLQQLTGKQETEVIGELKGLIYLDPKTKQWLPQDAYLSGNVRDKLEVARIAAKQDERFSENVEALLAVQPKDLLPGDIDVQLGAPWLATEDIRDFAAHLLEVPEDQVDAITVHHSPFLAAWTVEGNYSLDSSFANTSTYGTARCTALDLIDKALNLKDPRVYDYDQDKRAILNTTETEAAREKLQKIKYEFERWVWRDPDRCERLVAKYNALYNNRRLREYDGSHLRLPGMSPHWEQKLHPHQRNAIWRCLQSSEPVLLAHCVGAGKTAEMTGAAMEAKRLGLLGENGKALIVVPNHMLEQVSGDFLKIYPAARVLAITKDQLQKGKREALINRIATNNWDAVIVTHKSFERIPLSSEAKLAFYHQEASRIEEAIAQTDGSNRGLVKRQESAKRRLDKRIEQATEDKDNTLSWEHLIEAGARMVLIDEAHAYKNLAFQTQMDSISGLNPDGSDRAFDLLMKIRYLQEQGGRTVFATATPLANSIAEAYTWERYCGSDEPFDAWAATFTNPTTNAEIGPTGTYKMRTVLAEYKNLPELMTRFRQFADVRTADQIKLPRPKVNYVNVAVEASPEQLEYMDSLVKRAEKLQHGGVDPRDDNALKIFHEGREVMLHQQLRDPILPDYPDNKLAVLANNVTRIWNETVAIRGTQLIFSDLGTPTKEGFSVYSYIHNKLLEQGIPAGEIAFIHDYDSDTKKDKLFEDVRQGRIRVLLGSTEKMGCGTNVQTRCVAIHHADIPFRPCDREQRDGRALRPGNLNEQIEIYTYVTQGRGNNAGLEAYMAQLNERKASFINKMMVGDLTERRAELDSKEQMSFGELKAISSGNPLIQKKVEVDAEVIKLRRLRQAHEDELYGIRLQLQQLPQKIELLRKDIAGFRTDLQSLHDTSGDRFYMTVRGRVFEERARAGEQINAISASLIRVQQFGRHDMGDFGGLKLAALLHPGDRDVTLVLQGQLSYYVTARQTPMGTISALEHQLRKIPETLEKAEEELAKTEQKYVAMRQSLGLGPAGTLDNTAELIAEVKSLPLPVFEHTQRLERLCEIQAELDRALGLGFDESRQDLTPDESYQLPADLEALLSRSAGGQQSAQTYVQSIELPQTQLDSAFKLLQQVTAEDLSSLASAPAIAVSDNDASSFLEDIASGEEIEAVELRQESPQEVSPIVLSQLPLEVVETEIEKPLTESTPAASAVPASLAPTTVAARLNPLTDIQLSLFESVPNVVPDASLPLVHSEARPENLLTQAPVIAHSTADVVHSHSQVNIIQQDMPLQQNPNASTLLSLSTWRQVAESLGKSDAYISRIDSITAEFYKGQPLSPPAHTAQENDFKLYQTINDSLNEWSKAASAIGKSDAYLARISDVTTQFGNGYPLSSQAQIAMQKDFESYSKFQSLLSTWQRVAQTFGRSDNYLQRLTTVAQNLNNGEPLTEQAQLAMQKDFQTHGQLQKTLQDWQRVAIALGKPDAYIQRIAVVAREFETGRPLSQPAKTALQQDFDTYKELQSHLKQWYEAARTIGKPIQYLSRIQKVASSFTDVQNPSPLSQRAIAAMQQDLHFYQQENSLMLNED